MAAMSLQDAIAALQTHARQLQAILTIAEVIRELGDVDRLRSEADAALTAKKAEVAAAQSELDKLSAQIKASNSAVIKAAQKVKDQEAAAVVAGQDTIEKARQQGQAIIEQARKEAADLAGDITAKQAELADLIAKAEAAGNLIETRAAEHQGLLDKIAETKDRIASLLKA